MGSGDFNTDDEDYEEYYSIDYDNGEDYYSVNVEPVIDNGIDSNGNIDFEEGAEGVSDLIIRITLLMKSPWIDALGMLSTFYTLC